MGHEKVWDMKRYGTQGQVSPCNMFAETFWHRVSRKSRK